MRDSVLLPAGKYYIGDPCYVFGDDWSPGICDIICDEAAEQIYRGRKFFAGSTAYGDGEYTGSNGFKYGVDAGLLGAIPLELVTDESGLQYGTVIEVKHGLFCSVDGDGYFTFAWEADRIEIRTNDEDILDLEDEDEFIDDDFGDDEA